jgi:DNA polymerase-3 subunit epsilon
LNGAGFFHQRHRAVKVYHALLEILDFVVPTGAPALALLRERARKKMVRVWAERYPFEHKDSLKPACTSTFARPCSMTRSRSSNNQASFES